MVAQKARYCQNGQLVHLLYLPFPTQNKASLCREESRSVWRLGYATSKFVNFDIHFVFVFTTNLILSTRQYFLYSIDFKNFERSKLDARSH